VDGLRLVLNLLLHSLVVQYTVTRKILLLPELPN
jgi:hypothetical protein